MKPYSLLAVAVLLTACSPAHPDKSSEASAVVASYSAVASSVQAAVATQLPAAFVGKWDAPPKPCSTDYRSDMQLDITATELTFFESGGTVKSVKVNGPRDVVAEVDMSGEGEEWHKSLHMTLSDDGKTLTLDDGKMGVRVRCS